jgi:hypothetical protein
MIHMGGGVGTERNGSIVLIVSWLLFSAGLTIAVLPKACRAQTPTATAAPRTVRISPVLTTIPTPGTTAQIGVSIDNAADLDGYNISISYDNPAAVQAIDVSFAGTRPDRGPRGRARIAGSHPVAVESVTALGRVSPGQRKRFGRLPREAGPGDRGGGPRLAAGCLHSAYTAKRRR